MKMTQISVAVTILLLMMFPLLNADTPALLDPVTLSGIPEDALSLEFPGGGKVFVTDDPGIPLGSESQALLSFATR